MLVREKAKSVILIFVLIFILSVADRLLPVDVEDHRHAA
jgi:hypothetical protein